MKESKGITLIALIVTVIVIMIIASIGIYVGIDSASHSRVLKFVSYMQVIQGKVDTICNSNENYTALGQSLQDSGRASDIINILNEAKNKGEIQNSYVESNNSSYRYFNKKALSNDLQLDNIEDEIVINFVTREVVSLNGIEYNKDGYSGMYYTQYLLPTGQKIITKTEGEARTVDFTIEKMIDGLNATIIINNISITNGTLSYKEENGSWIEISNYTRINEPENVTITKSGVYIFRLIDNTNKLNSCEKDTNLVLANPPILNDGLTYVKENYDYSKGINSTYGAVATDGIYQYVWVPRFSYKRNNNNTVTSRFVKGVSSITTYNKQLEDDWIVPDKFSNQSSIGYLERTGIWMEESEIDSLTTEIPKYITITYDKNCGENVTNLPTNYTVEAGMKVAISQLLPTRSGYIFKGWDISSQSTEGTYQPGNAYTFDEDVTLYAIWELDTRTLIFKRPYGSTALNNNISRIKIYFIPKANNVTWDSATISEYNNYDTSKGSIVSSKYYWYYKLQYYCYVTDNSENKVIEIDSPQSSLSYTIELENASKYEYAIIQVGYLNGGNPIYNITSSSWSCDSYEKVFYQTVVSGENEGPDGRYYSPMFNAVVYKIN